MTTAHEPRVEIERVRANLAGLYTTVVGVLIFNVAVFFEWATTNNDGFSGYESDSLWPFTAYLGLGFAAALLYAANRAYRRQHRGLRSEEHTSELQSRQHIVCRLLLAKKKTYALASWIYRVT